MSTYKEKDPATDLLLDFLVTDESGGNYNAVIGKPRATDDLSLRTINGVYDLQDYLVSIGRPSGAVGRYQIIKKTLRGLQSQLGLSGSERFTPEMQDRLAVQLLVNRGYSSWWRGEISDEAFAHNLSMEWASLPDPEKNGRSHYEGIAGNSSRMPLARVYEALRQARAAIETSQEQTQTMSDTGRPPAAVDQQRIIAEVLGQLLPALDARIAAQAPVQKGSFAAIGPVVAPILSRLSQPSSYAGLGTLLALFGGALPDPLLVQLGQGLAAAFAVLAFLLNERGRPTNA